MRKLHRKEYFRSIFAKVVIGYYSTVCGYVEHRLLLFLESYIQDVVKWYVKYLSAFTGERYNAHRPLLSILISFSFTSGFVNVLSGSLFRKIPLKARIPAMSSTPSVTVIVLAYIM